MRETVIVEAVRTPVGKRNGGLSEMHAADLSALVLTALVERAGIDPGIVDDVVWGCVSQVGDQSSNIGRYSVLAAGLARDHSGHHGQPRLRVEPAGAGFRRAGRDVRPAGRRRGGRCRGDEPGSARLGAGHRHAVRPESACALWRFLVQPGHLRGDDRAEVGLLAGPARRVLGALARARGCRAGRRRLRNADHAGVHRRRAGRRRRGHPPGHHRREARRTEAGVQGRRRHPRGQLVADLRRRGGAAGDDGRERCCAWARRRSRDTAQAPSPGPIRC